MADTVDAATRSRIMSRIRSKDTKPELALRGALWARGLRYRKHYTPSSYFRHTVDIAFPGRKVAVFVDGCFWHLCPEHGAIPKSNREYWRRKLEWNAAKDAMTTNSLELNGWAVLRFWEHESPEDAADTVEENLKEL